jgi:hypothetical protein
VLWLTVAPVAGASLVGLGWESRRKRWGSPHFFSGPLLLQGSPIPSFVLPLPWAQ